MNMIHNNEYIQKKSKHIIKLIMSQTFHGFNEMFAVTFLTTLQHDWWMLENPKYIIHLDVKNGVAVCHTFFFPHVLWHS